MNLGAVIGGLFGIYVGVKKLRQGLEEGREQRPRSPSRQLGRGNVVEVGGMRVEHVDVKNIDERLSYIVDKINKGYIDPRIRKFTVELLSRKCGDTWCVPEKDWKAEVIAIFQAVRQHVRYVRDPTDRDLFAHPRRTLEFGGGDCDDYVIVLGSMLKTVGYHCTLRVIQTIDSEEFNHIYLLVLIPAGNGKAERWMPLDASVDRPPGWEAPARIVAAKRDYPVG